MEYLSALCAVFTVHHVLFLWLKAVLKGKIVFHIHTTILLKKQVVGRKSGNFENWAI